MPGALVDTDVLIEILRGSVTDAQRIDTAAAGNDRHVSVLTIAELRAGSNGDDPAIELLLAGFRQLSLDLKVAENGGRLRRKYGSKGGTGLIDAILAATAIAHDLVLVTNNLRHFPMPELTLG